MKKKFTHTFIALLILAFLVHSKVQAQSLTHPHIWVKDSEKQIILNKINNNTWAENLYNQYINRVKPQKDAHKANPATFIDNIPNIPGDRIKHRKFLTLGYESALLYWLTGNNDYGQLAGDILFYYTEKISKIPGELDFYTNTPYLQESREAYTKPPMIYDFVYSYLKKTGVKVFDKKTGKNVSFNFSNAQKAFKKMADQIFTRGLKNNNHPVLEAPGALFNVLAIDDDATRSTYFNKFMDGTEKQNGLKWMIHECIESGLWPESTGYSIGPHRIILHLMEITDRYEPSLNIISKNKEILKNVFFYENYRYPDNRNVMRFGDAHRTRLNTQAIAERVLTISKRKGYNLISREAENILKSIYNNKQNGFNPSVSTQTLEWHNPLYLLWGENVKWQNAPPLKYNSSVTVKYSGITMQRNIFTSNPKESGLMGYTGGAHYVHSHLTGIDMELYGLGTILGTGGGDMNRNTDIFRNYHRIYAGHNTVIINSKSKGRGKGAWKSDNQLKQSDTKTIAAEPASQKKPISKEFSFSAQVLDDAINKAKQQRVFSIIRTSDNTGYYFDLFRSKSLEKNNYHDYLYHNIGDDINMVDANKRVLPLSPKLNRYTSTRSTFGKKHIMFPGWHYFKDIKTSDKTTSAVKATIPMTKEGIRYMHMLMPGGESREYTACKGPETLEATAGYKGEKTPIVAIRNYGEAWTKPFISIFEPSRNENGSVLSVENLYKESKIVGAKVISIIGNKTITDYIISNEDANDTYSSEDGKINFTGRFGIIRLLKEGTKSKVTLYIGEGTTLSYSSLLINGDADKKGLLVADNPESANPNRILEFKNLTFNHKILKGTNLTIRATVGSEYTSVSLWHGTVNLGTINNGLYTWFGHDVLSNMNDDSYTFKLVAKDATNSETERYITIKTSPNTVFSGEGSYKIYNPNKSKWLGYDIVSNDALVTDNEKEDISEFNFLPNGARFNIYTKDYQKILIINAERNNTIMLASASDEIINSDGALFNITETGNNTKLYFISSKVLDDGSNVNLNVKNNGSDVGRGTSKQNNYKWSFTKLRGIVTNTITLKNESLGIKVYPNPTNSKFNISIKGINIAFVKIYNTSGKLVFSKKTSANRIQLSKDGVFSPGVYLIEVIDDKHNTYHQKIVIE